jgi:hypothetical protein
MGYLRCYEEQRSPVVSNGESLGCSGAAKEGMWRRSMLQMLRCGADGVEAWCYHNTAVMLWGFKGGAAE